jgi:hypothetical protein
MNYFLLVLILPESKEILCEEENKKRETPTEALKEPCSASVRNYLFCCGFIITSLSLLLFTITQEECQKIY